MTRDLKYTNLANQFYGENQRHTSYLDELLNLYKDNQDVCNQDS